MIVQEGKSSQISNVFFLLGVWGIFLTLKSVTKQLQKNLWKHISVFWQFKQFQALTQARLDMLALNQNRNSSGELGSRVQALSDNLHHMSQELDHLRQSTTQETEGLRLEPGYKY